MRAFAKPIAGPQVGPQDVDDALGRLEKVLPGFGALGVEHSGQSDISCTGGSCKLGSATVSTIFHEARSYLAPGLRCRLRNGGRLKTKLTLA